MKQIITLIFALVFVSIAHSAPKIKFLNKYQFNKLDKIEKEYYLKKIIKHYVAFEARLSKKNKLVVRNEFSLPSLFNTAYAAKYTSETHCIVGANIVKRQQNGKCSIRNLFTKSCNPNKAQKNLNFQCGEIYGNVCVPFRDKGKHMSADCADIAEQKGFFDPSNRELVTKMKSYITSICKGRNLQSDGCTVLKNQLNFEYEVAERLARDVRAEKDCESRYEDLKLTGAQLVPTPCSIRLINGDSQWETKDYDGDDIEQIIAAINNGTIPVVDITADLDDLVRRYKATKCGGIVLSTEYEDTNAVVMAKCGGGSVSPDKSGSSVDSNAK